MVRTLRALLLGTVVTILTLLTPVHATASPATQYFETVAAELQHSQVFVDRKALLPLKPGQVEQLNKQVAESKVTIYLAHIDKRQVTGHSANDWPALLHNALNKPGIYAVYGDKLVAEGFDVPPHIAEQVNTLASQAYSANKAIHVVQAMPYEVFKNFVAGITATQDTSQSTSLSDLPDSVVLFLLALTLLILLIVYIKRRIQDALSRRRTRHIKKDEPTLLTTSRDGPTTSTKAEDTTKPSAAAPGIMPLPLGGIPVTTGHADGDNSPHAPSPHDSTGGAHGSSAPNTSPGD